MTAAGAATAEDLAFLSLSGAGALLRAGKVSPVELVRACLARIESQNPALNAFITVTDESALQEARTVERQMRQGEWRGPLHGIPIAVKDMIDTRGVRTTGASAVYFDRIPTTDAAVISRLKRAGAILLGKLNMQEFAIGGSSVPSHYGAVRNPWSTERIAGGSSGGSAAAVAAGLCYAALGTDTGGSVRQPAALCGVVGLKPTYGRVSNLGVLPLAPSLDHVGPLTRSVEDCATVLEAIAGYEPSDVSSERRPIALRPWPQSPRPVRVGVPRAFFYDGLHPAVSRGVEAALATLADLGARIEEVTLEVSTDRTVFQAEAYASHAELIADRAEQYLPETLAKLRRGASIAVPAYLRSRLALAQQRRAIAKLFTRIDVLAMPTVAAPAWPIRDYPRTFEAVVDWEAGTLLRNTRPFNSLGIPTISIPCGRSDENLPIGLQLAAGAWQERRLLAFALAYEAATASQILRPGMSVMRASASR